MRKAASVVAAAGLLAAVPLAAQDEPQPERVHVVRQGETLWDIARAYLDDPFLWPEIFRLNTDVIQDPARIYPSERLVLPAGSGRGDAGGFATDNRPQGPTLRGIATRDFPEVLAGDFYRASFVAREGEVRPVGRLAETEARSVINAHAEPGINLYDRVFVVVDPAAVREGDRLHFLRRGRSLRRAGRVYQPTAVGTVAALDGTTATVVIVGLFDRVAVDDVVVPWERFPVPGTARSQPVEADLQGTIMAFLDARPLQMTQSILFLDLGRDAGVAVGDVFEAYDAATERRWGTRPEAVVARMQVVRVTDRSATVRVTDLDQPNIRIGQAVRRVARMP